MKNNDFHKLFNVFLLQVGGPMGHFDSKLGDLGPSWLPVGGSWAILVQVGGSSWPFWLPVGGLGGLAGSKAILAPSWELLALSWPLGSKLKLKLTLKLKITENIQIIMIFICFFRKMLLLSWGS